MKSEQYLELMKTNVDALIDLIDAMTVEAKIALIKELDAANKPVIRNLAYDYNTQKWLV